MNKQYDTRFASLQSKPGGTCFRRPNWGSQKGRRDAPFSVYILPRLCCCARGLLPNAKRWCNGVHTIIIVIVPRPFSLLFRCAIVALQLWAIDPRSASPLSSLLTSRAGGAMLHSQNSWQCIKRARSLHLALFMQKIEYNSLDY